MTDTLDELDMISNTDELDITTNGMFNDEKGEKMRKTIRNTVADRKPKSKPKSKPKKPKMNGKPKVEDEDLSSDSEEDEKMVDTFCGVDENGEFSELDGRKTKLKRQRKKEKGIRKTPYKNNVRDIIKHIRDNDKFFRDDPKLKGKNFSVESQSYDMLKKASEEHISNIFSIAQLLSRANEKSTVSPLYFSIAALIANKPNSKLWTNEDMLKIRLAKVGINYENVDDETYYTIDEILDSKNWRKLHEANEGLMEVDLHNKQANAVDEYLEDNEFDDPPRREAILSGLTEHSVKLGIEPPYDEKKILKVSRRNKNSKDEVERRFRKKNNLKPISKTRKRRANRARDKAIKDELLKMIDEGLEV